MASDAQSATGFDFCARADECEATFSTGRQQVKPKPLLALLATEICNAARS